ncbi:MAG: 50S ribosome-binding GTPase [Acidobacteriota bacterium]|nr:50S ribosome-binding GTPase [Acidobacteriota bacterium]
MLKEVRVLKVGPLASVDLHDLGRISVICGKNNSGKSTLLNALSNPDHRAAGGSISTDEAEKVAIEAANATMLRHGSGYDVERSIYTQWVMRLVQSRKHMVHE